jgi:SAM-dependent methyltransferase
VPGTQSSLRSYSSALGGPFGSVREGINLVRAYSSDVSRQVGAAIAHLSTIEELVNAHTGIRLEGLELLDVGAGQRLTAMRYFSALGNDVVGIDRDLIVQGFDPVGYLRMARSNGLRRAIKTAGRKSLRYDARFNAELRRQLGSKANTNARMRVHQMDAARLDFPDGAFDLSYSSSVMQYVDDPVAVLREMARVVRPGGGAFVDFMLYTGPTGCLDIRMLGGRDALPHWAHLRRRTADSVRENAPLNRLRLSEWRSAFATAMPGSVVLLHHPDREALEREILEIRCRDDDLLDYEFDELVTTHVFVVWRRD